MAALNAHAQQLYIDLGLLGESNVSQVGKALSSLYNTLLDEAKSRFPEDKLIEALTPVGDSMHPRVLQALVGQLRLVLGNA
jgi:hypothetical protein